MGGDEAKTADKYTTNNSDQRMTRVDPDSTSASKGDDRSERTYLQNRLDKLTQRGIDAASDMVDVIVEMAIQCSASDVHLEPISEGMTIRMRLDGVMQDFALLPDQLASNIVARCKVMAGLLTYRCNVPQEGGVSGDDYASGLDLRVSTYPTLHGERVAIRLFDSNSSLKTLPGLGLTERIQDKLTECLSAPEGMILLSGPSGSGKTTTLYACLNQIRQQSGGGRHIVSVEDPIENEVKGVTQTAVNNAVGLTFASSLRSLLRQDPEVMMVGEIRDAETADIAIEAALTGHLVLSTVHAPRATLVPHRLLDMGVEPYALVSALRLVLSQRLVRKLCSKCKQPANTREKESLPHKIRDTAMVAEGCPACHQTGYNGRILLAEKMETSEKLHDAVMEQASRREFQNLIPEQNDIVSQAWEHVTSGHTTAFEIRRVMGRNECEISL